jgi:radial spoke head protein 4A
MSPPLVRGLPHLPLSHPGSLPWLEAALTFPSPVPFAAKQAFFSQAGADGVSVRSHLTEVIHRLLLSKEGDALEKLESISLEVKAAHFNAASSGKENTQLPAGSVPVGAAGSAIVPTETWLKSAKSLHTQATPPLHTPEAPPLPFTSDLPDQLPMFAWAGVGLSKEETYRIHLAMQKLAADKSLPAIRFLGKIFGTKADYVILEAKAASVEAHIAPSKVGTTPPEAPGVGLNGAIYFVASSAADEFVQLEDVTPEQVLASMTVRKYFTGELAAPVACYPAFPGPEAAYLRAQIARIVQGTSICPDGKLAFDEEFEGDGPKPMKVNAEYAVPGDLKALESWVHCCGGILKIGRITNVPKPEPVDGEEPAEDEELEAEKEPLYSIAEDEAVVEEQLPAWSAAAYHNVYDPYSVTILKSNRWPGAYAAAAKVGDKAACVYFGSGHEATGKAFTPVAPPPIMGESADSEEAPEVALADENALLKEIDEAKLLAANADAEPAPEE